jgi:hypothetical protein
MIQRLGKHGKQRKTRLVLGSTWPRTSLVQGHWLGGALRRRKDFVPGEDGHGGDHVFAGEIVMP